MIGLLAKALREWRHGAAPATACGDNGRDADAHATTAGADRNYALSAVASLIQAEQAAPEVDGSFEPQDRALCAKS